MNNRKQVKSNLDDKRLSYMIAQLLSSKDNEDFVIKEKLIEMKKEYISTLKEAAENGYDFAVNEWNSLNS